MVRPRKCKNIHVETLRDWMERIEEVAAAVDLLQPIASPEFAKATANLRDELRKALDREESRA